MILSLQFQFDHLVRLGNRFTTETNKFKYFPHTKRPGFNLRASRQAVKQPTGNTQNNDRYVEPPRDAGRFISHYDENFVGAQTKGPYKATTVQCDNGFTKSNIEYKLQLNKDMDCQMPPWNSAEMLMTKLEKNKMIRNNPAPFDETRNYKMRPTPVPVVSNEINFIV